MDAFNKGNVVKTKEGGVANYVTQVLKIQNVFLKEGEYEGNTTYQFDMDIVNENKDLMKLWQSAKFTDDGELRSPAYGSFIGSDGTEVTASPIYEIMQAAKALDEEEYEKRKKDTKTKTGRKWKEFLEGLKFEMEVKTGDKKKGGRYNIIMTERQKAKEEKNREEYKAERDGAGYMKEEGSTPSTEAKGSLIDPADVPF